MKYYINQVAYPCKKDAYDRIKRRLRDKGVKFLEKNLLNGKLLIYDVRQ